MECVACQEQDNVSCLSCHSATCVRHRRCNEQYSRTALQSRGGHGAGGLQGVDKLGKLFGPWKGMDLLMQGDMQTQAC